jgi:UDP-glucuronate decarboxylase
MDDPKQRQPDIALARAVLRWEPTVQLADGLERTIAYFRDQVLTRQIADLAALARSAQPSVRTVPDELGAGTGATPLAQTA